MLSQALYSLLIVKIMDGIKENAQIICK